MPAFWVLLAGVLIALWLASSRWRRLRRRRQIAAQPFPEAWRQILKIHVPYVRTLPVDLQLQLKKHIQVFLAEKQFVGCAGLTVTDAMRVTIAAQACLLLLNRNTDYYPKLRQILIYPSAFIVDKAHTDHNGLELQQRRVLSGESWAQGQVILSWHDSLEDARVPDDGRNVVIHEFAHQLDQEKGQATGAPILARTEHYAEWTRVFSAEFAQLQQQLRHGVPTLLNPYGATDPAEFFAVVTEVFFEQPREMSEWHPALYQQLARFYHLNPLSWA